MAACEQRITAAGFVPQADHCQSSAVPYRDVIDVLGPTPGLTEPTGTTVTIAVSSGPGIAPGTPEPPHAVVSLGTGCQGEPG